jgi:hypothetical protein
VTEYDRRSEALVLAEIERRYPAHAVLAEESGAHRGSETRWIRHPEPFGTTSCEFPRDRPELPQQVSSTTMESRSPIPVPISSSPLVVERCSGIGMS